MRRWALSLIATIGIVLGTALPAAAEGPVPLGQGSVTDTAGVLSGAETAAAEERLDTLRDETGLDLWVVFVSDFTSPADAEEWANTTAEQNGLGPTQYLLAVAVDGRRFYLSGDSAGPLTENQLGTIEQGVQPFLRDEDWAGAVDAAADGMTSAAGGGSGAPSSGSASGGGAGTVIAVIAVVAIIVVVVFFVVRARRKRGAVVGDPASEPLESLATRAAQALVQADDAVRTGQEELGFASAQFGDAATAQLQAALTEAQQDLDQAFRIRQQLDDGTPDTPEQQRAWHRQTLELAEGAQARLQEQVGAFAELRKLEQDAPAALERLTAQRASTAAGTDAAEGALARLSGSYTAAAVAPVADNVAQARERLALADAQIAAAGQALAAGDSGAAAVAIHTGEQAVSQAGQLLTAVESHGTRLAEAATQLPALRAEVERDIAAAAALPDADGRIHQAVAAAQQALTAAPGGDPLQALQQLQDADSHLDTLIGQARDAAERAARARAVLSATLTQANAQAATAADFIASRRGAVGATARTRLAEAQTALGQAQALAQADPEQALALAQRAEQLARQSLQAAQSDVGSFSSTSRGGGGDLGAMLGGIVIGSALSRGSSRPSYRSGPTIRSSGSRSRSGGGGFSGGGSRSRRGGGRF
ncbi:TPM domain-containing protein [Microbacterium sp. GXF7504]